MAKPAQYAALKIDTVEVSKANDSLQEQLAICRFMIDKYNRRKKGQDLLDVDKLLYYANWKKEVIEKIVKQKIKGNE